MAVQNYYELLGLPLTANAESIEEACRARYTHFRHLTTHHNPDTAEHATRMLREVEAARATLTDPVTRTAYDSTLRPEVVGGLVDSDADSSPSTSGVVPLPRRSPITATVERQHLALHWVCPNAACGADNPEHTRHCLSCGTQLLRQCPACEEVASLVRSGRCGKCGADYAQVIEQRAEEERMSGLRAASVARREALVSELRDIDEANETLAREYGAAEGRRYTIPATSGSGVTMLALLASLVIPALPAVMLLVPLRIDGPLGAVFNLIKGLILIGGMALSPLLFYASLSSILAAADPPPLDLVQNTAPPYNKPLLPGWAPLGWNGLVGLLIASLYAAVTAQPGISQAGVGAFLAAVSQVWWLQIYAYSLFAAIGLGFLAWLWMGSRWRIFRQAVVQGNLAIEAELEQHRLRGTSLRQHRAQIEAMLAAEATQDQAIVELSIGRP